MSNKHKKPIKTNTINRVVFALFSAVVFALIIVVGVLIYKLKQLEKPDAFTVYSKSIEASGAYDYAQLTILRQENVDGSTYTAEYVTSEEKNGSYSTYMFRDSEDNSLYQCWLPNDSDSYDIYIRSDELETWVKTSMSEPPITTSLWETVTFLGGYSLMESYYPWYDTGDMCYVLQRIGTVDGWDACYEEVYIRKDDFLPMGIVLIVGNSTDVIDHTDIESGVQIGSDSADVEYSTYGYDSIIQKYSMVWSNEDMRLFDAPDVFITDEEYLSITNGQEVDSDGESEEVSGGN